MAIRSSSRCSSCAAPGGVPPGRQARRKAEGVGPLLSMPIFFPASSGTVGNIRPKAATEQNIPKVTSIYSQSQPQQQSPSQAFNRAAAKGGDRPEYSTYALNPATADTRLSILQNHIFLPSKSPPLSRVLLRRNLASMLCFMPFWNVCPPHWCVDPINLNRFTDNMLSRVWI